jgi:hypothetical protein
MLKLEVGWATSEVRQHRRRSRKTAPAHPVFMDDSSTLCPPMIRQLLLPVLCTTAWLTAVVSSAQTAPTQETPEQQLIISVQRIWDRAEHSAFTDLIRFGGRYYSSHEGKTAIYMASLRLSVLQSW